MKMCKRNVEGAFLGQGRIILLIFVFIASVLVSACDSAYGVHRKPIKGSAKGKMYKK